MKEISIQEYQAMRNEAWDMMVATNMVEKNDDWQWQVFDMYYHQYLIDEKKFKIIS
jgi:hypothetical protein|tara:strand:- start:1702 stop:1869 length:168 start_codon:yes stop_codon:yes gene_type:complete